ncbi:hypothetical protein [Burkholderia cepacia]|uniref:hypothetical protein n=1 Tax=Burkholderia cepacia TaxID=292 RepID=UPI00298FDF00|nr:hypothetical protein [Burkholderia cepacia]
MLQVRNGCAGFRAQSESRGWPMHRGNTGGIDSFLVVRRHTNTDNITDSSHSNDTLYSVRKYRRFKLFRHFYGKRNPFEGDRNRLRSANPNPPYHALFIANQ